MRPGAAASSGSAVPEEAQTTSTAVATAAKRPRTAAGPEGGAFNSLVHLILYQQHSRFVAAAAEERLRQALGGALTPGALRGITGGAAGITRLTQQERWGKKAEAMLSLAAPVRRGPHDAADRAFEGRWRSASRALARGLSACYEVKRGSSTCSCLRAPP